MITFGHAEFAQLILEVFALLQDRALLRGLSRKKLIVNARSAGIIISLEPVYAMTYAWWWLHGAPSYRMLTGAVLTGAVLIVLSIVLSAQSAGESRRTNSGAATLLTYGDLATSCDNQGRADHRCFLFFKKLSGFPQIC
ncbi:hypothetical protein [Pseudomonas sp. H2_G03]